MIRSTGSLQMRPAATGEDRAEARDETRAEANAEAKPERFAPASSRSKVRRKPQRASYDPQVVFAILDAGLVAHVAFVHDGHPFVIPMVYARKDRELMLHGSAASRMLEVGAGGALLSACVTIIDGLVYGHSAMHHSMNYRSVVVLGRAREVVAEPEKRAFLAALVERSSPGRSRLVRPPSDKELAATRVLALPIEEASAKIRAGGPLIDAEDLAVPVWTGQLPISLRAMSPIPTPDDERSEALGGGDPAGSAGGAGGNARRGINERSEALGGGDPAGSAGGAGGNARRGINERSEALGGGDPAGSAGGAGGNARRGINERSEALGGGDPAGSAGGAGGNARRGINERSEALGGGDPAGSAGGAGGNARRGIDERSEALGGGDPAGSAGGVGGNARRGINAPRLEPPVRPYGVD